MQIIKYVPDTFASNAYILTADGKNAIVIDPSEPEVIDYAASKNLDIKCALLTHGHFDHVGGCGALFEKLTPIYAGINEKNLIFSKEYRNIFGGVFVPDFEIYDTLSEGQQISICGINFKVLETPGHTAGSLVFIVDDCMFTGDTVFCGNVGRWDLPTGNFDVLMQSIKRIASFKENYKLYCGHGEDTTLDEQRQNNYYFKVLKC